MNKPIIEKMYGNKKNDIPYEEWWAVEDTETYIHMLQLIKTIDENQKERNWNDLQHGKLYQDTPQGILNGGDYQRSTDVRRSSVTYNVVKATTDTLVSKIGQNKPRPRTLTEKGDYHQQLRAKELTRYVDGILGDTKTYRKGPQIFKDGGIFGTGCLKVFSEDGKIKTERVLITEILVDDLEGAYGDPQSIYQTKLVSRNVLLKLFPKHKQEIENATPDDITNRKKQTVDLIKVYEGWHKKGKHVLAIENVTLLCEPWEHDYFPFAFFRYNTSIASFYGNGIAEELRGTQIEINKILRDIQQAQNLIAVPRILIDYGSSIVASHVNNEKGSIIKYRGKKPDFHTPTAMNNEIYSHVKWLISSAFEKVGLSQLSVASKKPAGLDSGRAIREFRDTESERFTSLTHQYEEFFEDVANLIISVSKDLYTNQKIDLEVKAESRSFIQSIKWSDVNMEDDKFVIRIQTSSLFPTTPAARLQKIEEYVRAGWMSRESAIQQMDHPDTESWATLETAGEEYVQKIVADILGSGKYVPPEPEILPERAINYARKAYMDAKKDEVKEEYTELLLRWMEQASSYLAPTSSTPVPVAAPTPESGTPTANPMPLPTTGLAPQV